MTEIQVRRDTVWQEKIVWRERRVWRDRVIFKEKSSYEPIAVSPESLGHPEQTPELFQPEFAVPRVGTSLNDAPELMRFFTQGDK